MDLDYEALVISATGGSPTATPTHTPSSGPTPIVTPTPPVNGWWKPSPGTSWQIQLQDTVDTSFDVQVYVIDLFDDNHAKSILVERLLFNATSYPIGATQCVYLLIYVSLCFEP